MAYENNKFSEASEKFIAWGKSRMMMMIKEKSRKREEEEKVVMVVEVKSAKSEIDKLRGETNKRKKKRGDSRQTRKADGTIQKKKNRNQKRSIWKKGDT